MKKTFLFALTLAASVWAFTACEGDKKSGAEDKTENNGNNGNEGNTPAASYATIWVSDSIQDENENPINEAVFVEIINDKQVLFHGQDTATYQVFKEHFFTITYKDEKKIEGEVMFGEGDWVCVDVNGALDHIGIWSGKEFARLFMYKLPKPEGQPIEVNEANILGKWRTTYEINTSYDNEGKNGYDTKFYHGYSIWDIQANGVAKEYSGQYSSDGWWVLDGNKLALYTGKKPASLKADHFRHVVLYSNFMHITHQTFRQDGTLYSSNQQFFYRVK